MKKSDSSKYALSLFSSAGIGELGVKACGIDILLCNELLKERCMLYHENYPNTESICGDIWTLQNKIIEEWKNKNVGNPFLVYATPPCQGMSFNSIGRIQYEIRMGKRPKEDPRNRLIIPTLEITKELQPQWILLENVPDMQLTVIRTEDNEYKNIIEYIKEKLGYGYVGKAEVVNCADYGIPQTRTRLITIFTKSEKGKAYLNKHSTFLPNRTHSQNGEKGLQKWVTLKEAIGNLPSLSAEKGKNESKAIPWHIVPIMKAEKFWWVKNTPYNETAYNNQCIECGYNETPRHGMFMKDGIHQSKKDTPIYCAKCGALLPRPSMIDKETGLRRRIKGFDSAYRRMVWELPSPTLTQNFQYEASDKKLHPEQNRTLSIYEALKLQTITEFDYKLSVNNKPISRNLCCQIIGESVPPRLIKLVCSNILAIEKEEIL